MLILCITQYSECKRKNEKKYSEAGEFYAKI